jgi:hypothetical protein
LVLLYPCIFWRALFSSSVATAYLPLTYLLSCIYAWRPGFGHKTIFFHLSACQPSVSLLCLVTYAAQYISELLRLLSLLELGLIVSLACVTAWRARSEDGLERPLISNGRARPGAVYYCIQLARSQGTAGRTIVSTLGM